MYNCNKIDINPHTIQRGSPQEQPHKIRPKMQILQDNEQICDHGNEYINL
jgi:hypothetical protein